MSKEMYDFKGILNLMIIQIRTGSDQNTQIRPKDPDPTKRPGSDQKTWIRPKDPDPTKRPGSDQKTRIRPEEPDPQPWCKLRCNHSVGPT